MPDDDFLIDLRMDRPTPARMYDYYLGGKDNFAVDREAAEQVLAAAPDVPALARANRAFLRRAVHHLAADAGIHQFIDIGTGLPTQGNVHEIAQAVDPANRVVYVDNDPIVRAHGNALLPTDGTTTVIEADLREPATILDHPHTRRLIDFDQPVGVLFIAVLHFVTDEEDPRAIVGAFTDAVVPGSHLAISHAAVTQANKDSASAVADIYNKRATSSVTLRTPEQIESLFGGHDIVEPGVVPFTDWRPDPSTDPRVRIPSWGLAGVGRKR